MPDPYQPASLQQLERLPYLTAVLMESLRLSNGVSTRLARVAPDRSLYFRDWEIPRGTPVGVSKILRAKVFRKRITDFEIYPDDKHTYTPKSGYFPTAVGLYTRALARSEREAAEGTLSGSVFQRLQRVCWHKVSLPRILTLRYLVVPTMIQSRLGGAVHDDGSNVY